MTRRAGPRDPMRPPDPAAPRDADRRLSVQYLIARAFAEADDLGDVADLLLDSLAGATGFDAAALWLPDDDGAALRCAAAIPETGRLAPWTSHTRQLTFRHGEGLPGRVWAERQAIWVRDTEVEPNFPRREIARRCGLRHAFAFPVAAHGVVRAVIELVAPEVRDVDADQQEFLGAVGDQLASLLVRIDARRALVESEARKGAVLEAAVDAIVSADEQGRILEFNRAAEQLFGYRADEVVGRTVASLLVPDELRSAHVTGLTQYVASGIPRILGSRVRTTARTAADDRLAVELTVTEARAGERRLFTAFIRDIRAEREAETVRDRFLEILSHELRTPLTAIYGGAKTVLRPTLDAVTRTRLLDDIAGEADRLHRLVEDLIVLARAERGAHDINLEPVHLVRVAERVIASVSTASPDADFRLRTAGVGQAVHGEETYIEQVVRNLLSNAAKYAAGDAVEVVVEYGTTEATVRVLDRGTGFGAAEATRLFDLGYRSPLARGVATGSGVGLFVARWLVTTMGGRIWATPRTAGGSEFGFALRVVDPDVPEPGELSVTDLGVGGAATEPAPATRKAPAPSSRGARGAG